MNKIENPYTPGAGSPPPILAGRSHDIESIRIAMLRTKQGKAEKSVALSGLRGVGKTVLLRYFETMAKELEIKTIYVEVSENRSLLEMLIPALRSVLLSMGSNEPTKKAMAAVVNFLKTHQTKIKIAVPNFANIELQPRFGLADSGNLEIDLCDMMQAVGESAKTANIAVVLFVDELQYVEKSALEALCAAFHWMAQTQLPLILIGAGLPQLRALLGQAKTYSERLFEVKEIDALDSAAAKDALIQPAQEKNVEFTESALDAIMEKTRGYPYFIQEWGKHAWNTAEQSPITDEDIKHASISAVRELDDGFFRIRFDRLRPAEKRYLRAMAELNQDTCRSGDIAEKLNRKSESLAPTRAELIKKGMAYSPAHGDVAFTVPLFGDFMKRMMETVDG